MMLDLAIYRSRGGERLLDLGAWSDDVVLRTNEHGFESLSATALVRLDEALRFYRRYGPLYVRCDWQGQVVWEGRFDDAGLKALAEGSAFGAGAFGYQQAYRDLESAYTALWSDTDVSHWETLTDLQIANTNAAQYDFEYSTRISIALKKNETYGNGADYGIVGYRVPSLSSRFITTLAFDMAHNLPAGWLIAIQTRDANWGSAVNTALIAAPGGAVSQSLCYTHSGAESVDVAIQNTTGAPYTYPGESGDTYFRLSNIRVTTAPLAVDTTLAANALAGATSISVTSATNIVVGMTLYLGGTNPEKVTVTSVAGTTIGISALVNAKSSTNTVRAQRVTAADIASDLVSTLAGINSSQLSTATHRIQSPGLDLTDEVYEDMTPADILDKLIGLGDDQTSPRQWEWAVWEGQVLRFQPRGTDARTWYVDAATLDINRTAQGLVNSAYAVHQDASGRTVRTAVSTDSASVQRYELTRRASISAETTNAAQAQVTRNAVLLDRKRLIPEVQVTFDAVYLATGQRMPLFLVRGGDTIVIRNIPPQLANESGVASFRVLTTEYNSRERQLTVTPESPPPLLSMLLARREERV